MKTPDEIKKGLECGFCYECPYNSNELETVEECARQVHKDAIAYIQQLESRLEQVERERDALLSDLELADRFDCICCVNSQNMATCDVECSKCLEPCICTQCENNSLWQWRGVCEENTKCDADA